MWYSVSARANGIRAQLIPGVAALKANARRFAGNVRPIIEEIVRAGPRSHNQSAAKLNERSVRTARGGVRGACASRGDPAPFRGRRRRVKHGKR